MAMKNPPHPGDFIRTEIIEPAGLTVTAAAAALKVSRPALSSLLNGNASLSGDMALRIEKAFGVRMETLMRIAVSFVRHCRDAQTRGVDSSEASCCAGCGSVAGREADSSAALRNDNKMAE